MNTSDRRNIRAEYWVGGRTLVELRGRGLCQTGRRGGQEERRRRKNCETAAMPHQLHSTSPSPLHHLHFYSTSPASTLPHPPPPWPHIPPLCLTYSNLRQGLHLHYVLSTHPYLTTLRYFQVHNLRYCLTYLHLHHPEPSPISTSTLEPLTKLSQFGQSGPIEGARANPRGKKE